MKPFIIMIVVIIVAVVVFMFFKFRNKIDAVEESSEAVNVISKTKGALATTGSYDMNVKFENLPVLTEEEVRQMENVVVESEILSLMGYPVESVKIFTKFYQQFFKDNIELEKFFESIFKFDETNKVPRRIFNQIQQLISIADDIDKIRPQRDPLRILFMRSCLEAIYKLAGLTNKEAGQFFEEYISEQGKEYILSSFKLFDMELKEELAYEKKIQFEHKKAFDFELKHFAELFRAVRNNVAHEGNYYEMQFWARDSECTWLSSCESNECVLGDSLWKKSEFGAVSFRFETTMMYEKFRYYFVEGCIKFLNEYIRKLDNSKQ